MSKKYLLFLVFFPLLCIGQHNDLKKVTNDYFSKQKNRKIEGKHGNLITDSIQRKAFFEKEKRYIDFNNKHSLRSAHALPGKRQRATGYRASWLARNQP